MTRPSVIDARFSQSISKVHDILITGGCVYVSGRLQRKQINFKNDSGRPQTNRLEKQTQQTKERRIEWSCSKTGVEAAAGDWIGVNE